MPSERSVFTTPAVLCRKLTRALELLKESGRIARDHADTQMYVGPLDALSSATELTLRELGRTNVVEVI